MNKHLKETFLFVVCICSRYLFVLYTFRLRFKSPPSKNSFLKLPNVNAHARHRGAFSSQTLCYLLWTLLLLLCLPLLWLFENNYSHYPPVYPLKLPTNHPNQWWPDSPSSVTRVAVCGSLHHNQPAQELPSSAPQRDVRRWVWLETALCSAVRALPPPVQAPWWISTAKNKRELRSDTRSVWGKDCGRRPVAFRRFLKSKSTGCT